MTRRFVLDFAWPALLAALDLRASDLLRRAGLPEGLLNTPRPSLNADDFAALWIATCPVKVDQRRRAAGGKNIGARGTLHGGHVKHLSRLDD